MRKLHLCVLLCVIANPASFAQVVTFPAPAEIQASTLYQLTADGKPVFVYDSPVASYAIFDFTGKVEVVIRADRDVKWVDVRPKSLGIQPAFRDSIIRIRLENPCNISIEINGNMPGHPLFLFTNPPESDIPKKGEKGIIFFESGKVHKPGLIRVNTGETVYIEGGAVVEGAILGENQENITVRGRGVLLGTHIREIITDRRRIQFINFRDSRNINIRDIILADGHTWQIVPVNCENVNIENVRVLSDNGGDDGIDIVRSRNVKIGGCFIRTKDDCIAIKTIMDYPPEVTTEKVNVTHSVFWNASYGNALEIGFELRSKEIRNISFRDCDVIHVENGAVFSIHNGDQSTVRDVVYENIRVEDARQILFDLAIFLSQYSVDKPSSREEINKRYFNGAWDGVLYLNANEKKEHASYRGKIQDILFKDIQVTDGPMPFSIISGYDNDHRVENVTFDNLTVFGRKIMSAGEGKFYTDNAIGIVFK